MPKHNNHKSNSRTILIIQTIYTYWTKASRGHTAATFRNGVVEQTILPEQEYSNQSIATLYHELSFQEHVGFITPQVYFAINPAIYPRYGCTTVARIEEGVLVTYQYNRQNGGAPDRAGLQHTMRAPVGEWIQVRENGRFSPAWEGDWWYHKVVVNTGVFDRIQPNTFLQKPPLASYSALADLW